VSAFHQGGWIAFSDRPGDDHNLYIATGDGSPWPELNDRANRAQDLTQLEGKMLRIHIDPSQPNTYAIPADNPFADSDTPGIRKEIFNYGLRNPFRNAFDRLTGDLYIADVGQTAREEINVQPASNPSGGENYAWRYREGKIATPTDIGGPLTGAPNERDPILDYAHVGAINPVRTMVGLAIIGGYVYRGNNFPELQGTYFFADLISNRIFSLRYDGTTVSDLRDWSTQVRPNGGLVSFVEDANGELYFLDQRTSSGNLSSSGMGELVMITGIPEPSSTVAILLASTVLLTRRGRRTAAKAA
jgi:glucose/arabinose dehydrogenase